MCRKLLMHQFYARNGCDKARLLHSIYNCLAINNVTALEWLSPARRHSLISKFLLEFDEIDILPEEDAFITACVQRFLDPTRIDEVQNTMDKNVK